MDKAVEFLSQRPVYNGHVTGHSTAPPSPHKDVVAARTWPMFCNLMDDVVAAPHLMELAISYIPIARDYFGEAPRLYSVNVFWTQPAPGQRPYEVTHTWHRDYDDRKQMAVFAYGTDVSDGAAHLYQRGTHVSNTGTGPVETVVGDAGTVFLTDPLGLHMGERPDRLRMLFWARFGVDRFCAPVSRALMGDRYPEDPELQEVIKQVVC